MPADPPDCPLCAPDEACGSCAGAGRRQALEDAVTSCATREEMLTAPRRYSGRKAQIIRQAIARPRPPQGPVPPLT